MLIVLVHQITADGPITQFYCETSSIGPFDAAPSLHSGEVCDYAHAVFLQITAQSVALSLYLKLWAVRSCMVL